MALPDLKGSYISNSYNGLLHTSNLTLDTSEFRTVYDGSGNASKLQLSNGGVKINDIKYPSVDGSNRQILLTDGNGGLSFSNLTVSDLPDLTPSPAGTYTSIGTIKVNNKGLVTSVTSSSEDSGTGTGDLTITSTHYVTSGLQSSPRLTIGDWVPYKINNDNWADSKAGIFYIELSELAEGLSLGDGKWYNIDASNSSNGDHIFPVLQLFGGEGHDGMGVQFSAPLYSNGNEKILYLRATSNGITDAITWKIRAIARQQ